MTTISHNLTGKLDERTVALLSEIDTIADDLKLPFFIAGATARDILLQHAHDIHPVRATLDIDIGSFSGTRNGQNGRPGNESQEGRAAHSNPRGKIWSTGPAKARWAPRR